MFFEIFEIRFIILVWVFKFILLEILGLVGGLYLMIKRMNEKGFKLD